MDEDTFFEDQARYCDKLAIKPLSIDPGCSGSRPQLSMSYLKARSVKYPLASSPPIRSSHQPQMLPSSLWILLEFLHRLSRHSTLEIDDWKYPDYCLEFPLNNWLFTNSRGTCAGTIVRRRRTS